MREVVVSPPARHEDSQHGSGDMDRGGTSPRPPRARGIVDQERWREGLATAQLFLSLPSQVFVVLLLEALNSYRNFGLRFVQYNYFVNEFGLSDTETGSLLGLKSTLDVIFAIMGSLATDALGVRKTALLALSMATVGRFLLAFGRTRTHLYIACLFFSPFGEAFLSVGLYKVALKRLTTPRIRPLAFAIQYATFNFAGALCDVFIDHLRRQDDQVFLGQVFTGMRVFVASTWVAVVVALVVALFLLQDLVVTDPEDPEPQYSAAGALGAPELGDTDKDSDDHGHDGGEDCEEQGGAGGARGRGEGGGGSAGDRDDVGLLKKERGASGDHDDIRVVVGMGEGGSGGGQEEGGRQGGRAEVGEEERGRERRGGVQGGNPLVRAWKWRQRAVARFRVAPTQLRSDGALAQLRCSRRVLDVL